MDTPRTITNLIKSTIHRAIRESAAGVLVIFAFTFILQHTMPDTARLLRLVPLWYLAPLCSGILLVFASAHAQFATVAFPHWFCWRAVRSGHLAQQICGPKARGERGHAKGLTRRCSPESLRG